MALQKDKELPSGVIGNYWKIVEARAEKDNCDLVVKIALFKDKAASDSGKKHLGLIHMFSGKKSSQELLGNLFELGYNMIKAQCSDSAPNTLSGKLIAYNDLKNAGDA